MNTLKRFLTLGLLVLLLLPLVTPAKEAGKFSFLVMGDTRSEAYLSPTMSKNRMEAILRHRYHDKEVILELKGKKPLRATIPRAGRSLVLHYNENEWPQRIEEFHNNAYRQIYTREGFEWVMNTAVKDLNTAKATRPVFLIHGGDIILNGYQGRSLSSPYWKLMWNKLLRHLPNRVYAAVGNHETWEDPKLEGMMAAMPWLKDTGFDEKKRIYSFDKENARFIFLNSGPQCDSEVGQNTDWCSTKPDYPAQMTFLRKELDNAKKNKLGHIFVTYHKPSYIKVGHNPLPAEKNPHHVLKAYADDFNIVVFNSHAHTTEHYLVDGVRYLVIGGGGAPQAFYPTRNPTKQTELYWKGAPRHEEYNILKITVSGTRVKGVLQRFQPGAGVSKVNMFALQQ